MDFYISDTPQNVLDNGEIYLAREWPFHGNFARNNVGINFGAYEKATLEKMGCLGELFALLLWMVTLGFWNADEGTHHWAQILATPHEGGTLLSVNSSKQDWLHELISWAQRRPEARTM